jgi:hypothetical protein
VRGVELEGEALGWLHRTVHWSPPSARSCPR